MDRGGNRWIGAGAVLAGTGVALGAFGAHALKTQVSPEDLATWKTAVEYQLIHALALLVVGLLSASRRGPTAGRAGMAFVAGIALFSGSLYVLVLSGIRALGAVTPLGGVAFLLGWAFLFGASFPEKPEP
jgi:uncharacterized membrane protein YgdD (TMEM256/DUF423 family)